MDRKSAIYSFTFHVVIVLAVLIGLPSFSPSDTILSSTVAIEVKSIADVESAKKEHAQKGKKVEEPKKMKPAVKKQAPRAEELPQPDVKQADKPEPAKEEKPDPVVAPKVEPAPVVVPKAEPAPVKEVKAKPAPVINQYASVKPQKKPKRKVVKKAKPAKKPEPKRSVTSILKNLKKKIKPESTEDELNLKQDYASEAEAAYSDAGANGVTQDELFDLREQLRQCWNVPAGAAYAENLVVDVRVWANPDGTVSRAEVSDKSRMSNPYFRAAADSALRAVKHPHCSPLRLPLHKYKQWRVFTFSFNPSEML